MILYVVKCLVCHIYVLGLFGATVFCFASFGFDLDCWFFGYFAELFIGLAELAFVGIPLSLSLLFSGLNMLFFFNFFCTGSEIVFVDLSATFPLVLVEAVEKMYIINYWTKLKLL